jgi:hypothetical protein
MTYFTTFDFSVLFRKAFVDKNLIILGSILKGYLEMLEPGELA